MPRIVALSGGVGGAKLASGFARILGPEELSIVVNTADDFVHWGLYISPDTDTVMYTLSGLAHPVQGWGIVDDTFSALAMVERLGGEGWFRLGDRDLGTHFVRTQALASGKTLTEVTATLCRALGVRHPVLPMSDGARRTVFDTTEHGTLSFQEYFVKHRFQPVVQRIRFEGDPPPSPAVFEAVAAADVVVVCPSNPDVSVDPILTLPGMRDAVAQKPVIAVSPIVGGKALKGAAGKMMIELGAGEPSAATVAKHYGDLLTVLVVEHGDEFEAPGLKVHPSQTIMLDWPDRERLATEVIALAKTMVL